MSKQIKVTLVKSVICSNERQRGTVHGLGLRKINTYKVLNDTPEIRGMISKVSHLVKVEEA